MAVTILFYTGLSAIVTSCSFAFASIFYVTDALYKRRERREHQAVLIDAWLSRVSRDGDDVDVYAEVSNRSDGSVRFVFFSVLNNFAVPMSNPSFIQIIPANSAGEFHEVWIGRVRIPNELSTWVEKDLFGYFKFEMSFADAAGINWRRNYQGRLNEIEAKPAQTPVI